MSRYRDLYLIRIQISHGFLMPTGTTDEGPVTRVNVERITNGIFVFSFLWLFSLIGTPHLPSWAGDSALEKFYQPQLIEIYNFIIVFLILAVIWIIMYRLFHQTAWIDRTFLYLHFLLLLLVIFIPFTNNLSLAIPGESVYTIRNSVLFHLNMLAIGLMLFFEWRYCQKKPVMLRPEAPRDEPLFFRTGLLIIPLTAIVGCVLSVYSLPNTQYIYLIATIVFAIIVAPISERMRKKRVVMIMTPSVPASGGEVRETRGVEGVLPQDMLEVLINALFALSLTMIVKNEFAPPKLAGASTFDPHFLMDMGSNFLFTFMILMIFYIQFFEIMKNIHVNDWTIASGSLVFILSILFLPLTLLFGTISDIVGGLFVEIFHINVLVSGFLLIVLWRYISGNPTLLTPGTDPAMVRSLSLRLLLLPVTAGAGFFLDHWQPTFDIISFGSLYLIPVVLFVFLSWKSDARRETEPAAL